MRTNISGLLIGLCLSVATARAELATGDIAIIAVNTDVSDDFAWLAVRDIPSNTVIHFTDSSVSNGMFRWTEHLSGISPGPLSWSSTGLVSAGTVVRWCGTNAQWSIGAAEGAAPALSVSGDQLIAYTGNIVSNGAFPGPWWGDPVGARMLFAVNIANGGWDDVNGGGTGTSFVPPGLSTNAGTALHLGGLDNACYGGPRNGIARIIKACIADPANWISSDEAMPASSWPDSFAIPAYPAGTLLMGK